MEDIQDLPSFIIKRLPVRYTYDNNYFNDLYQGIPIGGYNVLIDKLFAGCDMETGVDYNENREKYNALGEKVLYIQEPLILIMITASENWNTEA